MTNPVFPTLSIGQDSSMYSVEFEDTAMKTTMDGGYVISRPKHTRKPRKTFKSGFSFLDATDKATLEQFYESVAAGSVIFDWTNPVQTVAVTYSADVVPVKIVSALTNVVYQVRFAEKLTFKYVGKGTNRRWDVTFSLEQA